MPRGIPNKTFHERFMSNIKISDSGCWIWQGTQCVGYGVCNPHGNVKDISGREYCHRYSFKHFKGEIPTGMEILHSCDVRLCVNPDHLSANTRAMNVLDLRNRNPRAFNRKITEDQHPIIRERAKVEKIKDIAKSYNVGRHTIGKIVSRSTAT